MCNCKLVNDLSRRKYSNEAYLLLINSLHTMKVSSKQERRSYQMAKVELFVFVATI